MIENLKAPPRCKREQDDAFVWKALVAGRKKHKLKTAIVSPNEYTVQMLKKFIYGLLIISISSRLLAFSSEEIEKGLVQTIDLPEGHSIQVPAFFEIKEDTPNDPSSVTFGDPAGYAYGTARLLPIAAQKMDTAFQSLQKSISERMADAVIGERTLDYFTMGPSKKALLMHLPITAPIEMSFSHLLVQTDEHILHIAISIPAEYTGEHAGRGTRFTRAILLALQDSAGRQLKPAKQPEVDRPISRRTFPKKQKNYAAHRWAVLPPC